MQRFGLEEEVIIKIQNVFSQFPEIEKAILYGSRAKGNYKPASDIDLSLVGTKLTLSVLNKIDWALDDLFLPYTFDLSVYSMLENKNLLEHIKRVGIVFFEKE